MVDHVKNKNIWLKISVQEFLGDIFFDYKLDFLPDDDKSEV